MDPRKELTIERLFDAPLDRVWRAWTDSEEVQKWWGPRGVTSPTCEWRPEPGGKIHIVMLAGETLGPMAGQEWPMRGQFQEVVPKSKLVFTGNALVDDKPILENRVTVTFEAQGGKTKMQLHVQVTMATPAAEGPLSGMKQGWTEQIDKLSEYVKEA